MNDSFQTPSATPVIHIDKPISSSMKKSKTKKSKISKLDISGPNTTTFVHVSGMKLDGKGEMKKVDNTDKLDPALRKFLAIAGMDENVMTEEEIVKVQEFAAKENIYDIYENKRLTRQATAQNRKPKPSPPGPPPRPPPRPLPDAPPERKRQGPHGQVPPPPPGPHPKNAVQGGGPPPPPPPGPPPTPSPGPPVAPSPNSKPKNEDFHSQIKNFSKEKLHNVDNVPKKPSTSDHLAAIRGGFKLKPASERVVKTKEPTTPPQPSGLDDVLKMALGKFKDANVVSDDEDDECVDSDEWSSDED